MHKLHTEHIHEGENLRDLFLTRSLWSSCGLTHRCCLNFLIYYNTKRSIWALLHGDALLEAHLGPVVLGRRISSEASHVAIFKVAWPRTRMMSLEVANRFDLMELYLNKILV